MKLANIRCGIARGILAAMILLSAACFAGAQSRPDVAEQLLAMANHARTIAGAQPLKWDSALAEAAMKHCERMSVESELEHRYPGELDLTERASAASAHFALIEENIAMAADALTIHSGWMNSEAHRENLLNPAIDHVGIAVIARSGYLYAVADYAHGVETMTQDQVESAIAKLIAKSGLSVSTGTSDARHACPMEHGVPRGINESQQAYVMRWQSAEIANLPQPLIRQLGTGQYKRAEVGSCPVNGTDAGFTVYRVAVLLY